MHKSDNPQGVCATIRISICLPTVNPEAVSVPPEALHTGENVVPGPGSGGLSSPSCRKPMTYATFIIFSSLKRHKRLQQRLHLAGAGLTYVEMEA